MAGMAVCGQYACTFGPCTKDRHFIAPGQGFGLHWLLLATGCSLMAKALP